MSRNVKSITDMEEVVRHKTKEDLEGAHLFRPHKSLSLPNLCILPLGVVPKKMPEVFISILKMSCPKESSVNDAIDHQLSSVKYTLFALAVTMVTKLDKGPLLAKCDIKSTFRLCGFSFVRFFFGGERIMVKRCLWAALFLARLLNALAAF